MPVKYERLPTSPGDSSPVPAYASSSSRSPSRSNSLTSTRSSSPPPYPPSPPSPYPTYLGSSGYALASPLDPDSDDPENISTFHSNPRTRDTRECIRAFHSDPRFNPPPPSPIARVALIVFVVALFYTAWLTRRMIWIDFGAGMGAPPKPDPNLGVY